MKQTSNTLLDHRLSSFYIVLDEIHKNLKEIGFLAKHFHDLRAGNIELRMKEDGLLQWKYTAGSEDSWEDFVNIVDITKETVVTAAGHSINTIDAKLDELIISFQEVLSSVTEVNKEINSIKDTLSLNATSIMEIGDRALITESEVGGLKEDNSALSNRITELEKLPTRLDTLSALVDDMESRVSQLENK